MIYCDEYFYVCNIGLFCMDVLIWGLDGWLIGVLDVSLVWLDYIECWNVLIGV